MRALSNRVWPVTANGVRSVVPRGASLVLAAAGGAAMMAGCSSPTGGTTTPAAPAITAPAATSAAATAAAPPVATASAPASGRAASAGGAPAAGSGAAAGAAGSAEAASEAAPLAPEVDLGAFTHELKEPVYTLGLGEPKVAAIGDEPWMKTGATWARIAFPEKLRPSDDATHTNVRIFFGRDDLPRVMGTRRRGGQESQLYLRYRHGRWQEERKEVARLLDPPARPLWGLLGHPDPEVACKQDDTCIIKRRTGWKTMPSGPGTPRVDLQQGVAWALHPDSVARLEQDRRWVTVGAPAPFRDPGGFCAVGDEVWVGEPGTQTIHHLRDGAWTREPSPVGAPAGMWASSRTDVWLAGARGLAHFDGARWSLVRGPRGPLVEVQERGGEVWAAGGSGVWVRAAR